MSLKVVVLNSFYVHVIPTGSANSQSKLAEERRDLLFRNVDAAKKQVPRLRSGRQIYKGKLQRLVFEWRSISALGKVRKRFESRRDGRVLTQTLSVGPIVDFGAVAARLKAGPYPFSLRAWV